MKLSRHWLSDFVDLTGISNESLAEIVTTRIAEVDGVSESGAPLSGAVVALIKSVTPINSKLRKTIVFDGTAERSVVCGAPNARAGMLTAYVPVGGKIYTSEGPAEVLKKEVGGELSEGILVSAKELDLFGDHEGILELDGHEPGASLSKIFQGLDFVIEIDNKSLTHRPDLWSHFGFARELAAVLRRPLKDDLDRFADTDANGAGLLTELGSGRGELTISVQKDTECRRFLGVLIEGVIPGVTPQWMRRRLHTIGSGQKNFLVDLSNYVMLDTGAPNHVFDLGKLRSPELFVRAAKNGEQLRGLDGIDYLLEQTDVVVADSSGPVSLAGILGGESTAVSADTTAILLEAACWDPVRIRKTAKKLNVRTDAALRFEKNQSPYLPPLAIQRYVQLLKQVQPGATITSRVADQFLQKPEKLSIASSFSYISQRLGQGAPEAIEMGVTLTSLGLTLNVEGDKFVAEVPYHRATRDISHADDLVEEVGRCHGYENISEAAPLVASVPSSLPAQRELEHECRDLLRGAGFNEYYAHSFVDPEYSLSLGYSMADAVIMQNPMDSNQGAMRTSLIPNAVQTLAENSRFEGSLQLFELGRAYSNKEEPRFANYKTLDRAANTAAKEKRLLCISTLSAEGGYSDLGAVAGVEFFGLLAVVKKIAALRSDSALRTEPIAPENALAWMHPYRAAKIFIGELELGTIAELAQRSDLKGRAVLCELEMDSLLESSKRASYKPVSKYPTSFFEVSIVCPRRTNYSTLERVLRESPKSELIQGIELLSLYEGKPLQEGEKSVSVRLIFGSNERTLLSQEIAEFQSEVMSSIESGGFALRR